MLICRPTGVLTNDRGNDIATCRECLLKAGLTNVNRFHDLTRVTGLDLNFNDMLSISAQESESRKGQPQIKACYLVPNPLIYGMIRMYQMLSESQGIDVHVSYNMPELAAVLGLEASQLTA